MPERADHRQPLDRRVRVPVACRVRSDAGARGFTLIESLFAIAIAAVLVGLSLPSLRGLSADSSTSAAVNELVFALQTARSEAIKRAGVVTLCASAEPLKGDADCDGEDFGDGWIVYFDADADGARGSTETLILQEGARSAFAFPGDDSGERRVLFGDTGASVSVLGSPRQVVIALVHVSGERRTVTVSANGRVASEAP